MGFIPSFNYDVCRCGYGKAEGIEPKDGKGIRKVLDDMLGRIQA